MRFLPVRARRQQTRRATGDGLSAAIAVLTATLRSQEGAGVDVDEALRQVLPEDCVELADVFAGMYALAHLLLLQISVATGEPVATPLQRLALLMYVPEDDR